MEAKDCLKSGEPLAVYTPCDILTVTVLRGRHISHGLWDHVDTPDPYIELRLPHAAIPAMRTKAINNNKNPVWNQTFVFHLNHDEENILEIYLREHIDLRPYPRTRMCKQDVKSLPFDETVVKTFNIGKKSEVDITFHLRTDTAPPDLRYCKRLCDAEKDFVRERRRVVFEAMNRLFADDGPHCEDQTPTIGLIGSGGGFRAMVGMAGVMKALTDQGMLDIISYIGSLSGSTWYVSTLYSEQDFPDSLLPNDTDWLNQYKEKIDQSLLWQLQPSCVYKYVKCLAAKWKHGQNISLTDVFGLVLGDLLLADRLCQSKLSDQRWLLGDGKAPMPLYSAIHVKGDVSAAEFSEHMEFNPFEVGMDKYGVYMDTKTFGSRYFNGKLVKRFPELKLHYLQGLWGSAHTILYDRLFGHTHEEHHCNEKKMKEEIETKMKEDYANQLDDLEGDDAVDEDHDEGDGDDEEMDEDEAETWKQKLADFFHVTELMRKRTGRAALVFSFLRNLRIKSEAFIEGVAEKCIPEMKKMFLVDAGLHCNCPFPLMLRTNRDVDIILSFDFTHRDTDETQPFGELLTAEKWARENGKRFPPIDISQYEGQPVQELYIFEDEEDPSCPVVLHFALINKEFRDYKEPGVKREAEEKAFADFKIFDEVDGETSVYDSFNFNYSHTDFDRMLKLMEFNTLLKMADIRSAILKKINFRRSGRPVTECRNICKKGHFKK